MSTLVTQNRARVAARADRMTPAAIAAELRIPIHRVEGYLDDIEMDEAIARDPDCAAEEKAQPAAPATLAPNADDVGAVPELKRCPHCNTVKPRTAFPGRAGKRRGQAGGWCRECDSQRSFEKPQTAARLIRNRAYHRAQAKLTQRYADEFKSIYETELSYATAEAEGLAAHADELGFPEGEAPRLRPGVNPADDDLRPRVNTDWCAECRAYHDAGHHIPACLPTEMEIAS